MLIRASYIKLNLAVTCPASDHIRQAGQRLELGTIVGGLHRRGLDIRSGNSSSGDGDPQVGMGGRRCVQPRGRHGPGRAPRVREEVVHVAQFLNRGEGPSTDDGGKV